MLVLAAAAILAFMAMAGRKDSTPSTPPLDRTRVEKAVDVAMATETDKQRIADFADALAPEYPDLAVKMRGKLS